MPGHFFLEFRQAQQIHAASAKATKSARMTKNLDREVSDPRRRMEHLSLACQAMWELLGERGGLTDDVLAEKMLEVDLRDGVQDGKIGMQIVQCPACGRNTNTKRTDCVYCGAALDKEHAFE